jgi:hypothetical protein
MVFRLLQLLINGPGLLRSFLIATSAMSHSLMLAQLAMRLIGSVAQTTGTRTDHWFRHGLSFLNLRVLLYIFCHRELDRGTASSNCNQLILEPGVSRTSANHISSSGRLRALPLKSESDSRKSL